MLAKNQLVSHLGERRERGGGRGEREEREGKEGGEEERTTFINKRQQTVSCYGLSTCKRKGLACWLKYQTKTENKL